MHEVINEILGLDEFTLRRMAVLWVVLWIVMLVAVLVDMQAGIHRARILKEKIHSHGLRKTFKKFGEYGLVVMLGMLVDVVGILFSIFSLPYISAGSVITAVTIEGFSVYESMKASQSLAASMVDIVGELVKSKSPDEVKKILDKLSDLVEKSNDIKSKR